jgi:hypothetical protein
MEHDGGEKWLSAAVEPSFKRQLWLKLCCFRMNISMQNWRQMAEKLDASVCVLENLLNSSLTAKDCAKTEVIKSERSVALQFPEDFFQASQDVSQQQQSIAPIERRQTSGRNTTVHDFNSIEKQIPAGVESISSPEEVLPEAQLKLHQSILNFKQFNSSLKPLLAILEFILQDMSGALNKKKLKSVSSPILTFPTHATYISGSGFDAYALKSLVQDLVDFYKEIGRESSLLADRFHPQTTLCPIYINLLLSRVRLAIM